MVVCGGEGVRGQTFGTGQMSYPAPASIDYAERSRPLDRRYSWLIRQLHGRLTQRWTWVGSIHGLGWVGSHFPAHVMAWVSLVE